MINQGTPKGLTTGLLDQSPLLLGAFLLAALLLPACDKLPIDSIAQKLVNPSKQDDGLFAPSTGDNNVADASKIKDNTTEPNTSQAHPTNDLQQEVLDSITAALPGYSQKNAKLLAQRVCSLIDANPTYRIIQRGSLCNEILLKDTTNAIMRDVQKRKKLDSPSAMLEIGVTAKPTGTPGNFLWMELWKVNTPTGSISYPMVFAEDGQGGAFFIALKTH
jgi:hypothetical protein